MLIRPFFSPMSPGNISTLQWRHNGHDNVSNHQPHDYLLNRLFRRRSKNTSKLRVTGLCVGNSPGPVNSPHKGPVTRKMCPFDDVIMNTECQWRIYTRRWTGSSIVRNQCWLVVKALRNCLAAKGWRVCTKFSKDWPPFRRHTIHLTNSDAMPFETDENTLLKLESKYWCFLVNVFHGVCPRWLCPFVPQCDNYLTHRSIPGRWGSYSKNIIFKFILENSRLGTRCKISLN